MTPRQARTLDERLLNLPAVLGCAMRAMRKEAGLSGRQMADLLGSHHPIVYRFENGRHMPSLESLQLWAWACDRETGELMLVVDRWLGIVPMTMPVMDGEEPPP